MVSIVLLSHNKAAYTRECLRSLLETRPTGFEIVSLDNGSTDETPALIAEFADRARPLGIGFQAIRFDRNLGCSTARNQAVASSTGEEIVFLDNDTLLPDPTWLVKLRNVLESDPRIALVGPKICYPFEPHPIQCAGVGVSRSGRVQFRGRGEPADDPRYAKIEEVQALISACFIFRRQLVDEIGGLDEAFNPIQYEDFDFCYRARSRGYRVVYAPDPVVYHWESITSDGTRDIPNRYVIIKNGMLFKKRWRRMFEKENGPSDEETRWKSIEMPSLKGRRRR
jgi:GT2 family glycosyltransferase